LSSNPERSRLAQAGRLGRQAEAAAAAGRVAEAVALLKEALRLDPHDRRTLQRLADIHRAQLGRPREAAGYYAARARCEEREGFETRAIAVWKLALRCDPALLEARERIGALYVGLGLAADARLHYETSAREMAEAGRVEEAAILRAHLATIEAPGVPAAVERPSPPAGTEPARAVPEEREPDDTALEFAADRFQSARLFHHYGMQAQARQQLEELVASLPEHLEGRQLLVEVCRALGDDEAAAQHLRVVTFVLRRQGEAPPPASEEPWALPPVEEWVVEEPEDPMASLMDEIREDVERVIERLNGKGGAQ
jgi:tetratricopeptide (TPR) repeat protein